MSKTIKERSVDWVNSINGSYEHQQGYIKGATEQRAIDIDKACEFIKNHVCDFQNDSTDSIDIDALVSTLRNSMQQN